MADLRRLDGTPLDLDRLGRNERVGDVLADLTRINDSGRMRAFVGVYLTPEGRWEACWQWPADGGGGFPWGLSLLGALRMAEADIAAAAIVAPAVAEPEPEPPEPEPA